MPECSIGLVPDVGGSLLLGRAAGGVGPYLGLTGDRMDAGDAIYAGFADHYVPASDWDDVKSMLTTTGTVTVPRHTAPASRLQSWQPELDTYFAAATASDIYAGLSDGPACQSARKLMDRNSPLAMACAVPLIASAKTKGTIHAALEQEFQFTYRAVEQSDFIEGIRAAIIDRDRRPNWKHSDIASVTTDDITEMTAPLGPQRLTF